MIWVSSFICPSNQHNSSSSEQKCGSSTPNSISTEKKTQSVFSSICDAILSEYYWIQSNLNRLVSACEFNIFPGKLLASTHNAGKASDSLEYAKFQHTPYKVPEAIEEKLAENGYKIPRIYPDSACTQLAPEQGLFLSPIPVDKGKCNGGVTLFLKKALDGADPSILAKEFKTGIPIEGVIHQELYMGFSSVSINRTMLKTMLEMLQNLPDTGDNEIVDPQNPRAACIISSYLHYLDQQMQSNMIRLSPIKSIDDYIQTHYQQPPLDDEEKVTLYHLVSRLQYGTNGDERLALEVMGLEIDPLTQNIIYTTSNAPGDILNRVQNLTAGAYKLRIPVYDSWGKLKAGHTIGFIVKEDGTTIFYDPNYSITEVQKENRQRAVKRVFKRYTGYSASGKNTVFRKLKHIWQGHANPPKNPTDNLQGFELLKLKLTPV